MNAAGALVIYILIWWCVFFAMLPMGVRGRWESESDNVEGADPGAPANPQLKKKALITTGVAFLFWLITCAVILSGVINFRD
jgi:predicted secreted protein